MFRVYRFADRHFHITAYCSLAKPPCNNSYTQRSSAVIYLFCCCLFRLELNSGYYAPIHLGCLPYAHLLPLRVRFLGSLLNMYFSWDARCILVYVQRPVTTIAMGLTVRYGYFTHLRSFALHCFVAFYSLDSMGRLCLLCLFGFTFAYFMGSAAHAVAVGQDNARAFCCASGFLLYRMWRQVLCPNSFVSCCVLRVWAFFRMVPCVVSVRGAVSGSRCLRVISPTLPSTAFRFFIAPCRRAC